MVLQLMNIIGLNSTGATLASCIRESMSRYPDLTSSLNFEWLVQAAKHISKVDTAEHIQVCASQLPPKSLAAICIACKFLCPMCSEDITHVAIS